MTDAEREELEARESQFVPALQTRIKKRISWLRIRLAEIAVALILVIGITYLTGAFTSQYRQSVLPQAWYSVSEIYVPDHPAGSDPEMIYDRIIRQPLTGFWVVEVQRRDEGGLFYSACTGSGVSYYDTDEAIPNNTVNWSWFIGETCAVPPGQYRLRAQWTIRPDGWPEKRVIATSNVFTVTPPAGIPST
jgi:hypothetical protein